MTPAPAPKLLRSILVALDNSPSSIASLELAALLAALHGAELRGLFVEDENLSRLAALPVARHLSMSEPVASERTVFPDLDVALRAQSNRVHSRLRSVAEGARIAWSFRSVRGKVTQELSAAAATADLVAIGRHGWRVGGRGGLGSTVRELLGKTTSSLLLLSRPEDSGLPLAVLWERSPEGLEALTLAEGLSRRRAQKLTVVVPSSPGGRADDAVREARSALAKLSKGPTNQAASIEAEFEVVEVGPGGRQALGLLLSPRRILVLPVGGPRFPSEEIGACLEAVDLTALCVRCRRHEPGS